MNCCDSYGTCTRGKDCPARPAMYEIPQPTAPAADLIRAANERIRRLEAGRAHLLTLADAPGNTLDDFAKWWGNRSMVGQVLYVCLAVAACGLTAGLLVGYAL